MTQIPSSTVTTIQIRHGVNIQLSISYDCISSGISIPQAPKLRSLVDQAILQWWNSLTNDQRFGASVSPLSLTISAHYQK